MAPRATMRADHGTVCRPPRRTRGLRRGSVGSTPIPCRCGVGGGVVAEYEGMRGEAPCARVPAAGRRVRPAVRGPPRRRVGARPGATGPADLGSARARPGRPGASARRLGARPVVRRGGGSRTRRSGRSSFRPPTGPSSTARSTLRFIRPSEPDPRLAVHQLPGDRSRRILPAGTPLHGPSASRCATSHGDASSGRARSRSCRRGRSHTLPREGVVRVPLESPMTRRSPRPVARAKTRLPSNTWVAVASRRSIDA